MIRTKKLAIHAEGDLVGQHSKTTEGILRYRGDDVVCVIDSERVGQDLATILGVRLSTPVPIVRDLAAALALGADTLLLGREPGGSVLPQHLRDTVRAAVDAGLDVVSGLHHRLADDAELRRHADAMGVTLWDVRTPPPEGLLSHYAPRRPGARVVLTVGSDMCVGKMTTALELCALARSRGLDPEFVATGQIGMMISHAGIPADAIASDFLNGHVDRCVREAVERSDWVFVEGQASLNHPTGSQVTLGLLHGALPDAMVLCHRAGATTLRRYRNCPVPPLSELVTMNETAVNWLHHGGNSRVVGIALNTAGLDDTQADAALRAAADETGLPVTDVLRHGAGPLLDALQAMAIPRLAAHVGTR
jgi:D-glutamate N-acetyltransferase